MKIKSPLVFNKKKEKGEEEGEDEDIKRKRKEREIGQLTRFGKVIFSYTIVMWKRNRENP